jgi:hypothetical protein
LGYRWCCDVPQVTQAALKERARTLLVAMTERSRWVYALPNASDFATVRAIFAAEGIAPSATEADGKVVKYEQGDASFVVFDASVELGAVLLTGIGDDATPWIRAILDATGFVPQSGLWERALAIGQPEATLALKLLAHMAIGWDDDWSDLFLLHLASPDPVVRHDATSALTMAAMVAGEADAALLLLEEARKRETYPKLADTLDDALRVLRAFRGDPAELAAVDDPNQTGE